MRVVALGAVLLWQAAAAVEPPVAQPDALRYERAIQVAAGAGQACAVLDGAVFAHAAPALVDLRLFAGGAGHEVPYAITLSETASEETQPAQVLNLGAADGGIAFDLAMPARAYTEVVLDLDPAVKDFLGAATVSGEDAPGGKATALGTFTVFDLSAQHLSRDTTLPLAESTFPYLHVELKMAAARGAAAVRFVPDVVQGAEVPPSREAETVFTAVAETSVIRTVGRESRTEFEIPARVPVERVEVEPAPGFKGNFSRDVRVTAMAEKAGDDGLAPLAEAVSGTILRVNANEGGREIRTQELGIDATLGANLQSAAKVQVAIENGDDQPLPIATVRLEMRQREVCFDAAGAGGGLALYYGDPRLAAPVYDYARLFTASEKALAAKLGPETLNPKYRAPVEEQRPFAERHPEVLWIALLGVIGVLGLVALRSARNAGLGGG